MCVPFKLLCLWLFFVIVQLLRHVQRFVGQRTAARQAPLSMGFSSQEYQGG